jgi:hypothetical protein
MLQPHRGGQYEESAVIIRAAARKEVNCKMLVRSRDASLRAAVMPLLLRIGGAALLMFFFRVWPPDCRTC